MQPVEAYLILSSVLLVVGIAGFLFRRETTIRLLSIGNMFIAATINVVAFSKSQGDSSGQAFAYLLCVVIASEFVAAAAILRRAPRKSLAAADSNS